MIRRVESKTVVTLILLMNT